MMPLRLRRRARRGTATSCGASLGAAAATCSEYSRGTPSTLTGGTRMVPRGGNRHSGCSPRGAGRSGWCWRGRRTHGGTLGTHGGTPGAHREALVVLVGVGEAEVRADHVALVAQQERLDARRPEVALPVSARVLSVSTHSTPDGFIIIALLQHA